MCHVLAEGERFWTANGLAVADRRKLLGDIATIVQRWSLTRERWINYRSLRPVAPLRFLCPVFSFLFLSFFFTCPDREQF
jgi:hypothetical protein